MKGSRGTENDPDGVHTLWQLEPTHPKPTSSETPSNGPSKQQWVIPLSQSISKLERKRCGCGKRLVSPGDEVRDIFNTS